MIKVEIITGSLPGSVQERINDFLKGLNLKFSDKYRIHFSTTRLEENNVEYAALIEYEDSG